MVSFIKMNLPLFLRLISSDIHNKEVSLSATEFNTLRILFKVVNSDGRSLESLQRPKSAASNKSQTGSVKPLSTFTQFYTQPQGQNTSSLKVHMNVITDWINNLLLTVEPTENQFKLNSLNKCVATKSFQEINPHYGNNCKMSIVNCEESNVYIDSNVDTLLISSCINCTVFVAAVTKMCTLEKCERVTVCVAANQIRVGSCIDSLIHCYTPVLSPVVYGDTRSLRFAPHNANYPHFLEHLRRASLKFELFSSDKQAAWFTSQINGFKNPIQMGQGDKSDRNDDSNNRTYSIMPTVDFNKIVLPNSMTDLSGSMDNKLPLCPLEYID